MNREAFRVVQRECEAVAEANYTRDQNAARARLGLAPERPMVTCPTCGAILDSEVIAEPHVEHCPLGRDE